MEQGFEWAFESIKANSWLISWLRPTPTHVLQVLQLDNIGRDPMPRHPSDVARVFRFAGSPFGVAKLIRRS